MAEGISRASFLIGAVGAGVAAAGPSTAAVAATPPTARTQSASGPLYDLEISEAADLIRQDPNVAIVMSSVGAGGPRSTSNSGTIFITLKPRDQRTLSADQVIQELRPKLAQIPGINVYLQNPPSLRIGGVFTKSQYQYTLQSLDLQALYGTAGKLVDALAKTPGFLDVTSDMDLSSPTVNVEIDRDRAASLGISAQQIEQALASSFGSQQISTIYTASAQYEVILELEENFQRDASALSRLYLRSATGSLVPLDAVAARASWRGERQLGRQMIRRDTIIGAAEPRRDFDRRFRPTSDRVRFRWERLALAQRRGEPIPPVEVYRVDGCHFVIDGHHRISIAAAAGERLIEANVTQLLTAVPSGPGRSPVHEDRPARAGVCCA